MFFCVKDSLHTVHLKGRDGSRNFSIVKFGPFLNGNARLGSDPESSCSEPESLPVGLCFSSGSLSSPSLSSSPRLPCSSPRLGSPIAIMSPFINNPPYSCWMSASLSSRWLVSKCFFSACSVLKLRWQRQHMVAALIT